MGGSVRDAVQPVALEARREERKAGEEQEPAAEEGAVGHSRRIVLASWRLDPAARCPPERRRASAGPNVAMDPPKAHRIVIARQHSSCMSSTAHGLRRYSAGEPADEGIRELFRLHGGPAAEPYLHELVVTAIKLSAEATEAGDLKLLNAALKELRHAFRVFAPYRDRCKVAIFGSARTAPDHLWSCLARDFGATMARRGWMSITGGAGGVMGAGIEGAGREAAFAVLVRLPFEEVPCPVLAGDPKQIRFKYFFTRKLVFVKESDAICLLPGGFGTHDEAFEILTLMQTGRAAPRPVVLLEDEQSGFWSEWLAFHRRHLVETALVSPEDFDLVTVARSASEASTAIRRFYRVYHSQRRVGDRLVLRLQRELPPAALEKLAAEHADAIAEGALCRSAPLPEERDEPDLARLPRLVFAARFDRPTALHRLIDHLNDL
jgi:uncharacterized protein (TIGR00730 family)